MKYIAILALIFSIQCRLYGKDKDFIFEQISPEAGFAFGAINTVIEDEDGFIWFGCNSGLYYYNTVEITKYNFDPQRKDSPQSNKINKLYKDLNTRLWVCTENGICYFNKTKNSFTRLDLKEPNNFLKHTYASFILQHSDKEYLTVINGSLFSFNIDEQILKTLKIGNLEAKSTITYLERGEDGRIYLGTSQGEVFINNSTDYHFTLFSKLKSSPVKTVCLINTLVWIGYDTGGIDLVNPAGIKVSEYRQENSGDKSLASNMVRKIIKRKNGEIWIGTFNGIYVINQSGIKLIRQNSYNKLPHNSIYDLFTDKNDGVWICTWSGGLAYYNDYNFHFEHVQKLANMVQTPRSVISSFAESTDGKIWVGSELLGLNEYNVSNQSMDLSDNKNYETVSLHVKSLASDKKNRLWIGTFNEGLYYLDKNLKKRIKAIDKSNARMNIISSITPVDTGIWVGTREGLIFYNPDNKLIKTYNYEELKIGTISSDKIWTTYLDSRGNLWVCTDFGLSVKYKDSGIFERFFYNENESSLSRNIIYSICEDISGKIWVGTNGGGINLYNPANEKFEKLDLNEKINNADIYSIIRDRSNNMWFSTNIGIHVYMANTNELKSFDERDGLQGMQFNPNSAFISSSGRLFWGGSNGFNTIDPATIKSNPIIPDVFISKIWINNIPISEHTIKSGNSKLHSTLLKKIELNHNQNSLSFNFAANNFIKSSKNWFRYRLKNYQNEWIETSSDKVASYTKIPPGTYLLQVLGSNNDGVYNTKARELSIRIYPPIWLSWYAFLLYLAIVVTILIIIIKEIIFRTKARNEIITEKYKREAEEMLFSEKTRFFTNVSHEFRTPLTLIISPLNNLIKKFRDDEPTLEQFKTMKRNADRLLRLTNQMLDFRLLELGKIKLKSNSHEVVGLCKEICECFDYLITEKERNFIFSSSFKNYYLTIDSDMIEKVVYNLLSNALKFSPDKGQIMLSVEQKMLDESAYNNDFYCSGSKFTGTSLEIKVKDFGKGMAPEFLPKIFERFFMNPGNEESGTGIGLHICQEYVRLHDGNILVTSEVGTGTTFILNLPVRTQPDCEAGVIIEQSHFGKVREIIASNPSGFNPINKNKVLLIAEDNDELRIYLKNYLMGGFKVLTAKNGNQAYEIALEVMPDMVISDILMPGLDGRQLTTQIRNNPKTKHIPVILLTALSGNSVQMDSLFRGADLFLTKPIDESMLLAQIENILANRANLIEKYTVGGSVTEKNTLPMSFIERAEKFILDNIRNEQLEINMLAAELNMSRSSLHRKIKVQTNQSSSEFIRDIRLKYAIRMMNENVYNMDEIAVLSGFNSASWFNRSFKEKYGKTPKEYKNELNKGKAKTSSR